MSTLDLTATVTVEQLIDSIARAGGKVSWTSGAPSRHTRMEIEDAEVDAEEAYDALPSSYFDRDDEDTTVSPDERDLRDFLGACLAGDRVMASALLPRIISDGPAQAWAEQALCFGGRA